MGDQEVLAFLRVNRKIFVNRTGLLESKD
jgi:hypothetical protein